MFFLCTPAPTATHIGVEPPPGSRLLGSGVEVVRQQVDSQEQEKDGASTQAGHLHQLRISVKARPYSNLGPPRLYVREEGERVL